MIAIDGRASAATTPAFGPVCSNGEYLGDNGVGLPGQDWQTRYVYYCPQGARTIQLLFAGSYADGYPPQELNLHDPQVMNLSVEIDVPPVWNPTTSYAVGDRVTGPVAADNQGGTYLAVSASLGSLPTASNTGRWRKITLQPVPITCGNVRPCVLGTHADASGQTVTNAFLATDPLDVNIRPGALIAIRAWVHQSGSQVMADGPSQTPRAGSYQKHSDVEPDLTLSGIRVPGGSAHNTGPFAIIGLQNVANPVPSACILGDSRVAGVAGLGFTYAPLLSGGQGYTADDVGRLVTNTDSGGTPDNAIESAVFVIQDVSGGKVTQVGVYYPGHYAVAVSSSNAGVASAPPLGPQPTHILYRTAGSGLMVNVPAGGVLSGSAGIYEDPRTLAQGFIQKGLSDAEIPFSSFSRSSDRVSIWTTPDGATQRLAAIQRAGCTSVVIGFGIRDSNAGESAQLMQSQYSDLARTLLALGTVKGVYLATLPPQTESTDHWMTVAQQTPVGFDETRKAVNTWERTVPSPFAGIFDVAAPLEVNKTGVRTLNGGLWIVNGKPHFPTPDKTHLAPGAAMLAAAAVTANARVLK